MNSKNKFKLPFVYQLHNKPSNHNDIPNSLEFEVENDNSLGLLKQKYSSITDEYLRKAYKLGSVIGGNTLEDEIGDQYTNGVLEYMESILLEDNYENKEVLEIGCGVGYLLNKIKQKKGSVLGVEPGIQGQIASERYGIKVIEGFYPEVDIDDKFDIIVSYCVLEHVPDPYSFLTNLKPLLKPNGKVFIIVPNEKPYIDSGDISTLFHEHWSYFTNNSLKNLYKKAGANSINIECSKYGGLLYSNFSFESDLEKKTNSFSNEIDNSYYNLFLNSTEQNAKKISEYLNGKTDVGVYVPLRIVNYLINHNIDIKNIRFFDDDKYSYGNFFPGINIKIENFNDFIQSPPSRVVIMSNFFEDAIKEKISTAIGQDIEIVLWSEIFKSTN